MTDLHLHHRIYTLNVRKESCVEQSPFLEIETDKYISNVPYLSPNSPIQRPIMAFLFAFNPASVLLFCQSCGKPAPPQKKLQKAFKTNLSNKNR